MLKNFPWTHEKLRFSAIKENFCSINSSLQFLHLFNYLTGFIQASGLNCNWQLFEIFWSPNNGFLIFRVTLWAPKLKLHFPLLRYVYIQNGVVQPEAQETQFAESRSNSRAKKRLYRSFLLAGSLCFLTQRKMPASCWLVTFAGCYGREITKIRVENCKKSRLWILHENLLR